MAPRIEKVWGSLFGASAVKRKDTAERDNLPKDQQNKGGQKDEDEGKQPVVDRETVEKAITDLRADATFIQNGMRVEMVNTKDGMTVRLTQGSGALIKTMTAEEFLKLRKTSDGDQAPRGKILDQKF